MNGLPLKSSRAKVKRAWSYLDKLGRVCDKARTDGLSGTYRGNEIVIRYQKPWETFTYISLNMGEVVHQARSALEHAVWELLPVDKQNARKGFPVLLSESKFDKIGCSMIDGVSTAAVEVIRRWQPFGPDYQDNPLFQLHELWNIDKHRSLNGCIALPQGGKIECTHWSGKEKKYSFRASKNLKDGDVIYKRSAEGFGFVSIEVNVSELVFEDGPLQNEPLLDGVRRMVVCADEIIAELVSTI